MSSNKNSPPSFPRENYSVLVQYEDTHWWFRARNLFIYWAIASRVIMRGDFLEIGCGTGFVTQFLEKKFHDVNFFAGELHKEGLFHASQRLSRTHCFELDALTLNASSEYDLVGCFDVIEHISLDAIVLSNISEALRPNGSLILTVPQHMFLWSNTDTIAGHKRRYSKSELLLKLRQAGFKIEVAISFVSLLFPLLFCVRYAARNAKYDARGEFNLPPIVNTVLFSIMRLELFLLSIGIRFPFGGSLLVIAHKK